MTPEQLKSSILQYAIQGKLVDRKKALARSSLHRYRKKKSG